MKLIRRAVDRFDPHFRPDGRLHRLHPLWEAMHTLVLTPGTVTSAAPHVRDRLDLKRVMTLVIVALAPCIAMALYNTGLQANLAIAGGAAPLDRWQSAILSGLGVAFDPDSVLACVLHGAAYYLPVLVVTFVAGVFWEVLFAIVRREEVNEGFFVTWMLFPLILPPTIPLWQVALGISFGVVVGKEVFGGTGMNILNPALVARAFLFFAYPSEISGNEVWTAAGPALEVDAITGATPLVDAMEGGTRAVEASLTWTDAFVGLMPGSMGETSALACLLGALLLVVTGIGSWRIMVGVVLGTTVAALGLNALDAGGNPMMSVPPWWHFVLGGWAFGTVFMATDPVTAAQTHRGRWIYGVAIGVLAVLIRVFNPAYPEGMMLAILLCNVFAPTIDYFVLRANARRRHRWRDRGGP